MDGFLIKSHYRTISTRAICENRFKDLAIEDLSLIWFHDPSPFSQLNWWLLTSKGCPGLGGERGFSWVWLSFFFGFFFSSVTLFVVWLVFLPLVGVSPVFGCERKETWPLED
jgi:hypothetical protein